MKDFGGILIIGSAIQFLFITYQELGTDFDTSATVGGARLRIAGLPNYLNPFRPRDMSTLTTQTHSQQQLYTSLPVTQFPLLHFFSRLTFQLSE